MMECVIGQKMLGGEAYINDVVYEFYHTELQEREIRVDGELGDWMESPKDSDIVVDDDDDDVDDVDGDEEEGRNSRNLEVHRRSRAKMPTKKPTEKPTIKKPTTKKPTTKKPTTKKPAPKQKPCEPQPITPKTKPDQKPKPGQTRPRALNAAKPKPAQKPAVDAGASCQVEDRLDCKTILAKYNANNAREQLATRDADVDSHGFVESATHSLLKRAPKYGSACREGSRTFNARPYPNNAAVVMVRGPHILL